MLFFFSLRKAVTWTALAALAVKNASFLNIAQELFPPACLTKPARLTGFPKYATLLA